MKKRTVIFRFADTVRLKDAEESLLLALLAAEGLYGRSRVRLETGYFMDRRKRACAIRACNEVGRDVARIFAGFCVREFGEDAFEIERVCGAPAARKEMHP